MCVFLVAQMIPWPRCDSGIATGRMEVGYHDYVTSGRGWGRSDLDACAPGVASPWGSLGGERGKGKR